MTDFHDAIQALSAAVVRSFGCPPAAVGRSPSVSAKHALIAELRSLGYFGPEGELDRRALANAYGVDL